MIELSSEEWGNLSYAYGSVGGIPNYLRSVYDDPITESEPNKNPWFYLWSALYHQGTIYFVSIAASPHIISVALKAVAKKLLFNRECVALLVD